ncbi:MAG: hypothetical protein ACXWR4_16080 [Bdellovibrionota bacterium]
MRTLFLRRTLSLLLLLTACSKQHESTTISAVVKPPAEASSTPFPERLATLEADPRICSSPSLQALAAVHEELRDSAASSLLQATDLTSATELATKTAPYFARVRALAERCAQDPQTSAAEKTRLATAGLIAASPADSAARMLLDKGDICAPTLDESRALAPEIERKELSRDTQERIEGACKKAADYSGSELSQMHAGLQRASSACTLDSLAFAGESRQRLAELYAEVSQPNRAAQLFALQLRLSLAGGMAEFNAACGAGNPAPPVLRVAALEGELKNLTQAPEHCRTLVPLTSLKTRASTVEATDEASLLSAKYQNATAARYDELQTSLNNEIWTCESEKEQHLRQAMLPQAVSAWKQFVAAGDCTEERLEAFPPLIAGEQDAKAHDKTIDLTATGRGQLDHGYRLLEQTMQTWADTCRASLTRAKQRADEDQRASDERKKLDEQRAQEPAQAPGTDPTPAPAPTPTPTPTPAPPSKPLPGPIPLPKPRPPQAPKNPPPSPAPAPTPIHVPGTSPASGQFDHAKRAGLTSPRWGDSAARKPWTEAVLNVVESHFAQFNEASDVEMFCPGYRSAQPFEQENCWLLLISAISERESGFQTGDSFVEPSGQASIGLLALSAGECANAPAAKSLANPVQNLICGANKMAFLIGRDHIIDGSRFDAAGNELSKAPGAAAYWSTPTPRHKRVDAKKHKTYNVGFKPEIIAITKKYKTTKWFKSFMR